MKLKTYFSIATAIASTALMGAFASAAHAINFTPQQAGEINVGLGCLDGTCLEPGSIFESIVSLEDATTGSRSRLFVDYFGEDDTQQSYGNGSVVFKTRDVGTTPSGYWFRPSEYNESNGSAEEKGQLEVGTYLFNFSQELAELTIDFFDTESKGTTGVLAINGQEVAQPDYVAKGGNSNIVSQTFTNVSSIVLKLGKDTPNGTGDGVDFRLSGQPAVASVPEPASVLGLLAIAGGSLLLKQSTAAAE